ncbi:MAG: MerR family transcriptional regulator [Kineosporiaceae bacterium]|jgi:MerR family transcriptional regulator, redox-sensitive transcriptional activator SoxR
MTRTSPDSNDSTTMTIGELSEITGLSVSAIRFYQRRGLLPARDSGSGWQRFSSETLDRLAVIELTKSAGFSLDETSRLLDALDTDPDSVPAAPAVWQGLAEHKLGEVDALLARLGHLRGLLADALDYAYLSPDRAHQLPAVLGWTAPGQETALHPVRVPESTEDLSRPRNGQRTR